MAYSDNEKQEALILLAYHKYDFKRVNELLGIPVMTLRRWNKSVPKKSVPEMLERAITRLLAQLPLQIPAKDYGVILGIMLDKWLLMQGHATSRTENVHQFFEGMTEDDWHSVKVEAERILTNAYSRGNGAGPDQSFSTD